MKGKITHWNDDRGYGFITPHRGGESLFFHVSSLNNRSRRPMLNEGISYRPSKGRNGKPCAVDIDYLLSPADSGTMWLRTSPAMLSALLFLVAVVLLVWTGLTTTEIADPGGYSYYVRGAANAVTDGNACIVGDAVGLATRDMCEGIGPAVRSGLLAARAIVTGEPYSLDGIAALSGAGLPSKLLERQFAGQRHGQRVGKAFGLPRDHHGVRHDLLRRGQEIDAAVLDGAGNLASHRVVDTSHPLVNDVNTRFDVPHSRWNAITRQQFDAAGLHVLAESEVGVHLATSPDGFRFVFFQGHPEYDTVSLLKEYKREVSRYANGERSDYPPFPDNHFRLREQAILDEYRLRLEAAREAGDPVPAFPEQLVASRIDNTWHDTAEGIVGNWIGLVYQLTHEQRKLPFMDGVDPANPLGLDWIAGAKK